MGTPITGQLTQRVPWRRPEPVVDAGYSLRELLVRQERWTAASSAILNAVQAAERLGRMVPPGCVVADTRVDVRENALVVTVTFESGEEPEQLAALDADGGTLEHVDHPAGHVVVPIGGVTTSADAAEALRRLATTDIFASDVKVVDRTDDFPEGAFPEGARVVEATYPDGGKLHVIYPDTEAGA